MLPAAQGSFELVVDGSGLITGLSNVQTPSYIRYRYGDSFNAVYPPGSPVVVDGHIEMEGGRHPFTLSEVVVSSMASQ